MTTTASVKCDGCGKAERAGPVFPRGWLRLHAYGRRSGDKEGVSTKIDTVDVCSVECVQKALEPVFTDLAS